MTTHCAFVGVMMRSRVEVPITNHLRGFAPNLEKYKVVQVFPCVGRQKSGGLQNF